MVQTSLLILAKTNIIHCWLFQCLQIISAKYIPKVSYFALKSSKVVEPPDPHCLRRRSRALLLKFQDPSLTILQSFYWRMKGCLWPSLSLAMWYKEAAVNTSLIYLVNRNPVLCHQSCSIVNHFTPEKLCSKQIHFHRFDLLLYTPGETLLDS